MTSEVVIPAGFYLPKLFKSHDSSFEAYSYADAAFKESKHYPPLSRFVLSLADLTGACRASLSVLRDVFMKHAQCHLSRPNPMSCIVLLGPAQLHTKQTREKKGSLLCANVSR